MPTSKPTQLQLPENFARLVFHNRYARLPEHFYARLNPTPVREPGLIKLNHALAEELGLDAGELESPAGIAMFAGNAIPPGAEPLAQAYAGHQFGYFNPQLGDGRAILLGEVVDRDGRARDIQLKGSGPTPFSRNGDGRAAVGPVVREYIVSEAMHALGIKTTRALAAVTTGEPVYRETALPGAVLTRVAASHIRIGTFEYFRNRGDEQAIKQLADFVIARHYPGIQQTNTASPYIGLLDAVMEAQASLVASWLHVGFIHGVMNTDNMSVSGETIDYGPCAFMDRYDPATVFSSIDTGGRYSYGNQAGIALWNLSRLAECLLPLIDKNMNTAVALAEEHLGKFPQIFERHWLTGMRRKIGLQAENEDDASLIETLLELMRQHQLDFTGTFRSLADFLQDNNATALSTVLPEWLAQWRERLQRQSPPLQQIAAQMNEINPVYIPRNHRVEAAIRAAVDDADYAPMDEMLRILREPYRRQAGADAYAEPAAPGEQVYRTFCGT